MAFGSFSSLFIALCSSSDVAVYLTSEFLGFASCLRSLGIHLPRLYINSFQEKFQDVFELFQQTLPIDFPGGKRNHKPVFHYAIFFARSDMALL